MSADAWLDALSRVAVIGILGAMWGDLRRRVIDLDNRVRSIEDRNTSVDARRP